MDKYIPVTITPGAFDRVQQIMYQKSVADEYGLRITASGVGCLGHSLGLGFDKPKSDDFVFEVENLKILIAKKIMIYVAGRRLELVKEGDSEGLRFVPDE